MASPENPPRKIRVLHVIDSLDLGGAQEALVNLVQFSNRDRYEIEVACLHRRGVYWKILEGLGVPLHSLSPHKLIPWYIPKLKWLMLTRRYEIVHCHLIASNLIAKPIAAAFGVRLRFNHDQTNDDYRATQKLRLSLDSLTNRLSTHIFAVSKSAADFLVEHEHVPAERVSVVHNGIDLERFAALSQEAREEARRKWRLPLQRPIIGGIGRLNYQKNFELFLRVAAAVRTEFPEALFVIAGSGPEEEKLRKLAAQLCLDDDAVLFLGYVGQMETLYPTLDLLLMTSRFEGLPMTLLEAMAMRVPVVASAVDGNAEIIRDGENGLLAPSEDEAAFVAAVKSLLRDRGNASRIAGAAHATVHTEFSARKMTRDVETHYERYLSA